MSTPIESSISSVEYILGFWAILGPTFGWYANSRLSNTQKIKDRKYKLIAYLDCWRAVIEKKTNRDYSGILKLYNEHVINFRGASSQVEMDRRKDKKYKELCSNLASIVYQDFVDAKDSPDYRNVVFVHIDALSDYLKK